MSGPPIKKRGAGRPPANESAAHRGAILDAATDVFLEYGFAKAKTEEIAKRAGASKQTLYLLFPSKVDLFEGLLQRYLEALKIPIASLSTLSCSSSAAASLQEFGTAIVREILRKPRQDLYRLMVAEAKQFPDLARAFWQQTNVKGRSALKQKLDLMVTAGQLTIEDTATAADQLLGSLLWTILVRFTLRVELTIQTEDEISAWVKSGVDVFVRAHRPAQSKT